MNNFKLYRILMFCALLCSNYLASAQFVSEKGRFEVNIIGGCPGTTISITKQNNLPHRLTYWYEAVKDTSFPPPGTATNELNHTYLTPGTYFIFEIDSNIDKPDDATKDFEFDWIKVIIGESTPPSFLIHNCDNNNVSVEVTDSLYDQYYVKYTSTDSVIAQPKSFTAPFNYSILGTYRIDVRGQYNDSKDNCATNSVGFVTIDAIIDPVINSIETTDRSTKRGSVQIIHSLGENTIYDLHRALNGKAAFTFETNISTTSSELKNIDTNKNFHCFFISTYDACKELTITSDTLCTVKMDVSSSDTGIKISWLTEKTLAQEYILLRDNKQLTKISDPLAVVYIDTAVICKKDYTYNVQAQFANSAFSIAEDTVVVAFSSGSLPAITSHPYSTVTNEAVELRWGLPNTGEIPFKDFIIEKSNGANRWRPAGTSLDSTFTDTNATYRQYLAYRISYEDDCKNLALPSPITVPVQLEQVSARGKIVRYRWNKYETWLQGIRSYTVQRVDSVGNVIEEYPVLSGREKQIEFSGDDLFDKLMRIKAVSLDEIPQTTYSNVIKTQLSTAMFLPTAFTPDQDNINDYFIAKGPFVFNFRMEIYNRWGNLIYKTTDLINGWDGKVNGEAYPEGTYIYKIFFEDGEGRKFDQSGAFALLRKRNN